MQRHSICTGVLASVAVMFFVPATASKHNDIIVGPIPARVVRVVDGDTVVVKARIWLGQEIETMIRLSGVDAPELRGGCPDESSLGHRAREFMTELVGDGDILLRDIRLGKYAGRVIARIQAPNGKDCTSALISTGLGREYKGGKRPSWC